MASKKKKAAPKKSNVVRTNFRQGAKKRGAGGAPRARPGDFDPDANVKQINEPAAEPAPDAIDTPPPFEEQPDFSRTVPKYGDEPF